MRCLSLLLVAIASGCEASYFVKQSDLARYTAERDSHPNRLIPARRETDGHPVMLRGETLDADNLPSAAPGAEVHVVPRSRNLIASAWLAGAGAVLTVAGAIAMGVGGGQGLGNFDEGGKGDGAFFGGLGVLGVGLALGNFSGIAGLASIRDAEAHRRALALAPVDPVIEEARTRRGTIQSGVASAVALTAMAVGGGMFRLAETNNCCAGGYTSGGIALLTLGSLAVIPSVVAFFVELRRHGEVRPAIEPLRPATWMPSE